MSTGIRRARSSKVHAGTRLFMVAGCVALLVAAVRYVTINANATVDLPEANERLVTQNEHRVTPPGPPPLNAPRIGDTVIATFSNARGTYIKRQNVGTKFYEQVVFYLTSTGGGGGGGGPADCDSER
jgi:hypothetical protein